MALKKLGVCGIPYPDFGKQPFHALGRIERVAEYAICLITGLVTTDPISTSNALGPIERVGWGLAKEEMTVPDIDGGCLCGGVRYKGEAEPVLTAVCYCKDCHKHTSSAFSVLIVLLRGDFKQRV